MTKSYILIILFLIVSFLLIILYKDRSGENLPSAPTDEITLLTNNLIQAKKDNNVDKMLKIAQQRQEKLISKLKDDPQSFLSYATLGSQKQSFPNEVKPYLEEEAQLEGKLIVVILDDFENKRSLTQYFLEVADDRYQLYFTKQPPNVSPGSIIKLKGVLLDQNLVVKI